MRLAYVAAASLAALVFWHPFAWLHALVAFTAGLVAWRAWPKHAWTAALVVALAPMGTGWEMAWLLLPAAVWMPAHPLRGFLAALTLVPAVVVGGHAVLLLILAAMLLASSTLGLWLIRTPPTPEGFTASRRAILYGTALLLVLVGALAPRVDALADGRLEEALALATLVGLGALQAVALLVAWRARDPAAAAWPLGASALLVLAGLTVLQSDLPTAGALAAAIVAASWQMPVLAGILRRIHPWLMGLVALLGLALRALP